MKPEDGQAIVTGAGRGLGRELARAIAARRVPVAALGRNLDDLRETAADAAITPVVCDMADPDAVTRVIADLDRKTPVTVLVNNAAVYPRRDFLDETAQSFADTMAVNLGGPVAATRAVLDGMVDRGYGRILNVATFADVSPLPASSAYAVSKGAARIFTRALIADLGDRFPGIVIGDWLPGMLATGMGIPDGLAPEIAAQWGAELALMHDVSLNGAIFEMDRELPPPRSLKRRVVDRLTFRRPVIRRLGREVA